MIVETEEAQVVEEIGCLERTPSGDDPVGMTLAEARSILKTLQEKLVENQVSAFLEASRQCRECGRRYLHKDCRKLIHRTVFGKLHLENPRWLTCACQSGTRKTFQPLKDLLPERSSPELKYLETKFAALMSYGLTVSILGEVLPIGEQLNPTAVRRQVALVSERMEAELGPEQWSMIEGTSGEWADLPRPGMPLTVGIDGGYVASNAAASRSEGWFEVLVAKSIPHEGKSRTFGSVVKIDEKPKRRLFELLREQGFQMNQQVTFLTDGGETVRDLPRYLNPRAEYYLDWFHIAMRLTVLVQSAKSAGPVTDSFRLECERRLESVKWYLWHGNTFEALNSLEDLWFELDSTEVEWPEKQKLLTRLEEFVTYVTRNQAAIPNFGERWRQGERISTGFTESAVNQVLSKRMVKRQQMRWSPRGAHRLLQVRTRVLDGEWGTTFRRWYPGQCAQTALAA